MYHIVVNPIAGKGKAKRNLEIVKRMFTQRELPFQVYETTREGEAAELAAKITGPALPSAETSANSLYEAEAALTTSDRPVEIVVVGGDGTLHEVLNGIREPAACRLGIVPSGTGNDFAEAAKIPLKAEQAVENILDGEAKETDFLVIGGRRCMNIGGLGMDVDVLVRCKKGRIKGKIKYLLSLLQSLFAFKGYKITIESGERTETRKALIAVACNGTQIGGGIRICPASVIDDGKIDVMAVDCSSKWQIVKAFLYLMRGKVLQYPAAEHFLCERVKLVPAAPCTVQLDGELYDGLDFDAEIERGLKIYR